MSVSRVVQVQFKDSLHATIITNTLKRVLAMKQECINPQTQKPYMLSIKVGKDISPEPLNNDFTHQFVIEFQNVADRDYYSAKDPAHHSVIEVLTPLVDKVQIVDIIDGEF